MTEQSGAAIRAERLTKQYALSTALNGVSFEVPRGRVVGLVGRNGSGKTTLLRCLQGLVLPTSGRAELFGVEGRSLGERELERLGVVHQESRFLGWKTVREHLDFVRTFYERWDGKREVRLIDAFDIPLTKRIDSLSGGELQRVAIATAVCHRPEVLLLDEPASALDPTGREVLFDLLSEIMREDEPAILLSSHHLDDVERCVDWVLCLDRGEVVRYDALDVLQERFAQWQVLPALGTEGPAWDGATFTEEWIVDAKVDGRVAVLVVEDGARHRAAFETAHGVAVQEQPVRLSRMFAVWSQQKRDSTRGGAQ